MAGEIPPMPGFLLKLRALILITLFFSWISGCSALGASDLPAPAQEASPPTVIVTATQAARTEHPAAAASATPIPATVSPTPEEATPVPASPTPETEAPAPTSLEVQQALTLPPPEETAETAPYIPPDIPNNPIEIHSLGPLSKVASPIHLYAVLRPGAGSKARIELLGEDGRLLFGETKVFNVPEGAQAVLSMDIAFEIAAAAETARLQMYVQDAFGRATALNSVPLVLLSLGDSDINSPTDVFDPITIGQPTRKALIQGGTLLVTGLARFPAGTTLLARLIAEDGQEVGMRLASVAGDTEALDAGYNPYAVEVPYQVGEPSPALLVVSAGDAGNTDIIHLTSVEVLLSP
jgi:hypothetical protein